jgi:hypothetical protein
LYPVDKTINGGWWNRDDKGAGTYGGIKSDMKLWGSLQDYNHVKGCLGPKVTPWKCIRSASDGNDIVPGRLEADGTVSCLSYNGKNCEWRSTFSGCQSVVTNPTQNVVPLMTGHTGSGKSWTGRVYDVFTKTNRAKLDELCPVDTAAGDKINVGNVETRTNYLYSGCTTENSCDSSQPDAVTEALLNKTEHCGAWELNSVGLKWNWDAKKWDKM